LSTGFDLDDAVATGGAREFLDTSADLGFNVVADGHRGKHDREVRLDRFAGVVLDRAGL
jgi:hypothetical protein